MTGVLEYLFSAASFVPHGYCLLWRPDLVALHPITDFLIASAYFSIPAAIFVFVCRRPDLEFKGIANLFSAFILLCGTTHLVGLGTLWFPYYGFEGLIKAATAGVSVVTAIALWPLLPRVLALPSPRQLREANASLETEISQRLLAEQELRDVNLELEERVAERTRTLDEANTGLHERERTRAEKCATSKYVRGNGTGDLHLRQRR